ncbi:DUF2125 domain-containing protein [Entomobacter blattae]|uniref:DUF2125 domain-containing protein n=1 Tax=Entomobacter blattae TaxID=2762277 RepID=A0A7H1NUY9_9PROT|nr:DUF2125 domain-containing protein [Entomobacter blattae]QNT79599.1 hypothetical protein JGUZn3_23990 [Entomobacter blattae]
MKIFLSACSGVLSFIRQKSRLLLLLAVVVIPSFVLTYHVIWNQVENHLEQNLKDYTNTLKNRGWIIPKFSYTKAGWPFSAKIVITNITLTGKLSPWNETIQWSGREIAANFTLLHPSTIRFDIQGLQALSIGPKENPETPLSFPPIRFWAQKFSILVPAFSTSMLHHAKIATQLFHIALAGAGPDNVVIVPKLESEILWTPTQASKTTQTQISLTAEKVQLHSSLKWPYDRMLSDVEWQSTLTGHLPQPPFTEHWFSSWQNRGGKFTVQNAKAKWGPLNIAFSGTSGLAPLATSAHNPSTHSPSVPTLGGAFVLELENYEATLKLLQQRRAISPEIYSLLKTYTSLLTQAKTSDPKPALKLPLSFKNNRLYFGNISLTPVLKWIQSIMNYNTSPTIVRSHL